MIILVHKIWSTIWVIYFKYNYWVESLSVFLKALSLCILPVCFPVRLCPFTPGWHGRLLPASAGRPTGPVGDSAAIALQLCVPGPRNEVSILILIMLAGL